MQNTAYKLENKFDIEFIEVTDQAVLDLFKKTFEENLNSWVEEIMLDKVGCTPSKFSIIQQYNWSEKYRISVEQKTDRLIRLDEYNYLINFLPKTDVYQVLVAVEVF
jgi:hypothetical protein